MASRAPHRACPHRTWMTVTASIVAATLASACASKGQRPDAAPWPRAGTAVSATALATPPLPRLKPAPERRYAALVAGGQHLVLPGDTLTGLAESYGVPLGELARLNDLSPPYRLRVGQVLTVRPEPPALPPAHVVQPGETLIVVAQRYGLRPAELARANDLQRPDLIRVGQTLQLPRPAERVQVARAEEAGAELWEKAAGLYDDDGQGFVWPIRGPIVSTFGPKGGGRRNDGINIAARHGTPVRAAADGVVVYVGDGVRGYGQMVLLRHADGYTTAYAHNAAVLVREGQRVARSEVIARVGTTGSVSEPQLHFELRRNGQALDPLDHLQRAVASSDN